MKHIYLQKQVEESCTEKQIKYIQDLMKRRYEKEWLDHLAFDTRNRLSKKTAGVLIKTLLNQEDFEIRVRKENE